MNKLVSIFLIAGFINFSFITTIAFFNKSLTQEMVINMGNVAEEEDENEEDSGFENDKLIDEIFEIALFKENLNAALLTAYRDYKLQYNPSKVSPPPEQV